jgi:hypothetical protein
MMQQETREKRDISPETNDQQPQPPNPSTPPPATHRSRRRIVLLTMVVVLAAGAYFVWRAFFATPKLPESIVALNSVPGGRQRQGRRRHRHVER